MKNILDVYASVSAWNAQRYEQQLSLTLAESLLREEYQEWKDAKTALAKLDALCDVSYVALGVAWKCNISPELLANKLAIYQLPALNILDNLPGMQPVYLLGAYIDCLAHDFEYGVADSIAYILHSCAMQAMYEWQLTPELWIKSLQAVCESNDTKVVVQVDADVKANAGNKGSSYVAPDAALIAILNENFKQRGLQ